MKLIKTAFITTAALVVAGSAQAASVNGTGYVTPDVIFGSGNANGSFTGVVGDGVELGLRGKLRYNTAGTPKNTFNYDGDRTYVFSPSAGNAPTNRSVFNFEWSINSDQGGVLGTLGDLNDLTYQLAIDFDPTAGTDFLSFDPINLPCADHAIGTNATGNGGGISASCGSATGVADYQNLIGDSNVAQNSWNLGFFNPLGFDPQTEGQYTIGLSAFSNGQLSASTSIDIIFGAVPVAPVPLPSGFPFLLAGLGGLGMIRRRKNKAA